MIQAEGTTSATSVETVAADPWIQVLTATNRDDTMEDNAVRLVGPTYKVDIEVEV